jgi:hypothetical protein
MPQNLSAQIVSSSPKVWHFDEKRLHWASVVREIGYLAASEMVAGTAESQKK